MVTNCAINGENFLIISLWLCTFSLAISAGAAFLLPFSIASNEVLLLYPNSYYVQWLNHSLVQGNYVVFQVHFSLSERTKAIFLTIVSYFRIMESYFSILQPIVIRFASFRVLFYRIRRVFGSPKSMYRNNYALDSKHVEIIRSNSFFRELRLVFTKP